MANAMPVQRVMCQEAYIGQMRMDAEWVTRHLLAYCGPGQHTFHALPSGARWCSDCYKEERSQGACLVCDSTFATLRNLIADPLLGNFDGELCEHCFQGLAELQGVNGPSAEADLRPGMG